MPQAAVPLKTRPVLDNEQSRVSQQRKGRPFRIATNNAGLGVEEVWAGKRHSLSSQVRLDTTSSQRASRQGFFAWFCSVFICKSLTEVLKQNPNHPIFVGSLHWKIILWSVRLFYLRGLTCIKSLTLNKAIVQMKSLSGRELKNCDSRAWCLSEPPISHRINRGRWFYNQSFYPDM